MKKSLLLNKDVIVFLDGGWESSGKVIEDKKDRIILQTQSSELILVFKKKISGLKITKVDQKQKTKEQDIDPNQRFFAFKQNTKEKERSSTSQKDSSTDDLSEGGLSLPHEVLLATPSGHPMFKDRVIDNDFSISLTPIIVPATAPQ